MKRGVLAVTLLVAALVPREADSAGVYENAAAESAFLLAPQRVMLRASLEVSRGDSLDGSIYRIYAAFPARSAFLVAVEQPLVTASDGPNIDSALGGLMVRLRARILGKRHVLWGVGSLDTGTGDTRLFPYSSESVEIAMGLAYTDSIGTFDIFAIAGYVWAQRIPESLTGLQDDHTRFTAGGGIRLGENGALRAGFTTMDFGGLDARRDIYFAGAGYRWTDAARFFLEGQFEMGPREQRASNWATTAGIAILF